MRSPEEQDAIRSLWKLYKILERLKVVSDRYTSLNGYISLSQDEMFVARYTKKGSVASDEY